LQTMQALSMTKVDGNKPIKRKAGAG